MSHEIRYYDFGENVDRRKIQERCDQYAKTEDWPEDCHGISPIRWLEDLGICNTRFEAERLIGAKDSGWYDCLAIRYKEHKNVVPTAKETELRRIAEERYTKWHNLQVAFHFANTKSSTTTCPKCESRLNISYLHGNNCPICHTDLRPTSTIERIDSLKSSYQKAQVALDEYLATQAEKNKNNYEVRWLVKIEFRT